MVEGGLDGFLAVRRRARGGIGSRDHVTQTIRAPQRTICPIPSRYPPINTFETVTTARGLATVLELEGWINDRLVSPRLKHLPRSEWLLRPANASVIMAVSLHAAPRARASPGHTSARNGTTTLTTAILEAVRGNRREIALSPKQEDRGYA